MKAKLLSFAFIYFSELGHFNALRRIKIKKIFCRFPRPGDLERGLSPVSNGLAGGSSYSSADRKSYSRHCHFPQQIVALSLHRQLPDARPIAALGGMTAPLIRRDLRSRYCASVQPPAPGGRNASPAGILATTVR